MTVLGLIKLANDGLLLWSAVGPLIQQLLAAGANGATPVSMEDVDKASDGSHMDRDGLLAAIQQAESEGR